MTSRAVRRAHLPGARHPFRERLWELLMLALHRCGRKADALAAFQRARTTLVGQLGIEPGHGLRSLEAAVLRNDPVLDLFGNEVASAAAISLRRSDPRTFADEEVPISALTWLLQDASLVPVSKGNGVVLQLVAGTEELTLLRAGEALSAVLLAATVWGLASHVRLDGATVLIRVGWPWPNAEPLPHSAR